MKSVNKRKFIKAILTLIISIVLIGSMACLFIDFCTYSSMQFRLPF